LYYVHVVCMSCARGYNYVHVVYIVCIMTHSLNDVYAVLYGVHVVYVTYKCEK
jgi:hypothetical protein